MEDRIHSSFSIRRFFRFRKRGVAVVVSGIYLSVASIVGFIVIFAIAVFNGVVLVSFKEKLLIDDVKELVKQAATLRLRPVLMTASTTLFGILPLLWATVKSSIRWQ